MKRKLPVLFFLFTAFAMSLIVSAQQWQWAAGAGGIENDFANCVDVDNSGNSFVTGKFFDAASFGTTTLSSPGLWSVYIAKYDAAGNLIWAVIAASDSAISASAIHVDPTGNITVAGQFFHSATFGTSMPVTLSSTGDYDVFVAKYNGAGDLLWAQSSGGPGIDYAGGIAGDAAGNIFVTGDFHISPFPFSGSKIFLAKYDSTGNAVWTRMSFSYGTDHFGNGIRVDAAGNIYLTGEFFNTLVFDSAQVIDAGNVESNSFVAKFDSSGTMLWGQKAGAGSGYCGSKAIDIDASGNAIITGYYHGTIDLGPFSITGTSGLASDVYIAKCDAAGNYVWVNKSAGAGNAKSISIDSAGNAFISGIFLQNITFGADMLACTGGSDIFITKVDPAGNFVWATSFGGPANDNIGSVKEHAGEIISAGYFIDTTYFGTSISLIAAGSGKSDIFLAKLNTFTGVPDYTGDGSPILFPDPASTEITLLGLRGNEKYRIVSTLGKTIREGNTEGTNKIPVTGLSNGIYFISVDSGTDAGSFRQFRFIKN
jgi:hypothetical protein